MTGAPRVALQLYTVRDLAAQDLVATIGRVAELGYEGVELAGLHGLAPSVVLGACRDGGIAICGAHVGVERFEDDPDRVAAELRALGLDAIVFPAPPHGDRNAALERLAAATVRATKLGLTPVFHNHARELERDADRTRPWEAIVAIPGLDLELDLGWAWVAGEDPAQLVRGLAGRVPLVHAKDHRRDGTLTPDCPIGDGEVDYVAALAAVVEAGVGWVVVEQDEPGADPLAAAARSLAAVRALLASG